MINVCHILSFVKLSRVLGFSTIATVNTSNASLQTETTKHTRLSIRKLMNILHTATRTTRHMARHKSVDFKIPHTKKKCYLYINIILPFLCNTCNSDFFASLQQEYEKCLQLPCETNLHCLDVINHILPSLNTMSQISLHHKNATT